jgi:crotonobetainyl-CoA:carnitine CoA-transferase CaiB-like acyl-CoA transferase
VRMDTSKGSPLQGLIQIDVGKGFDLLDGVRVLDLTTSIAGPYATMLLSDFGAEVIKIERPEGDDARHWGPPFLDGVGLWFLSVNRNKKSVVLDLTTQEGRDNLFALVRTSDVVVSNQPVSVQQKLRLTMEDFRRVNPNIIMTSITGFGLSGARADLTCYDLIAEGYSGIMDVTGAAESDPQKVGAPAADMLAGQDAAMATLAALFDRNRKGRGHQIDVALAESMTRFLTCRISSYMGSGEVPKRSGGTDSVIAIYQAFETADFPITLGIGTDAIWRRFWTAMAQPEYALDPAYGSNVKRRANRRQIISDIQKLLRCQSREHWLAVFAAARIPAGPINSVDQVVADIDFQERGMIAALHEDGRVTPHVGLGIQIDQTCATPRSTAPHLGADTEAVLAHVRTFVSGDYS